MERQLVVFSVADEDYGVDIGSVETIVKMQDITVIPHAIAFIEGITNLRGVVLPVINLRKRFGMPKKESDQNTRIIVAMKDEMKVGMIVDSVSEVLRISAQEIEPPPPMTTTVDSAFITGIAKVDDRLIILLNLGKILTVEEVNELKNVEKNMDAVAE